MAMSKVRRVNRLRSQGSAASKHDSRANDGQVIMSSHHLLRNQTKISNKLASPHNTEKATLRYGCNSGNHQSQGPTAAPVTINTRSQWGRFITHSPRLYWKRKGLLPWSKLKSIDFGSSVIHDE